MVCALLAVMHPLLRTTLLDYCEAEEVLCGEAATAEDLWGELQRHEWDVLVLDLCLPQHTRLQTVRAIHGRYPNLAIVAISLAVDIPTRCWKDAGASGFVSKTKLGAELVEAVKVISQGGLYFTA
jgi:DNA-binding NarL/FixJ family response regulator